MLKRILFLVLTAFLAACVSGDGQNVLNSAVPSQQPVPPQIQQPNPAQVAGNISDRAASPNNAFAFDQNVFEPVYRPRIRKTYLINGLASNVEAIGYGFTNLAKKIPGSSLHNYASFIESSTLIRAQITRELKAAYRRNPEVEINLIGISFGANIVTLIAGDLDRSGIPVNYLATMEGPAMVPIRDNVRVADNFSCTNLDCFRTKSILAWGNKNTQYRSFKIKSSHIPLANHPQVHQRILSQINALPPIIVGQQ
ncbi:MAG: hypothetical protein AAF423_10600 [Pseudomonadota bacterium]